MKKMTMSAGLASLAMLCSSAAHAICHVDASATGTNQGSSWTDAYTSLQSALTNSACSETWVAAGTYRPGSSRSNAFSIRAGSIVLGGFVGNETTRDEADPSAHPTILSGNIGDENLATDNSYHVVVLDGSSSATPIGASTQLDGFVVSDGNADGGFPDNSGGGLYCRGDGSASASCSPKLSRLRFTNNAARNGGAMFLRADFAGKASPILSDVIFLDNLAEANGGAMYVWATLNGRANPAIERATFASNRADRGGAIFTTGGNQGGNADVSVTNATFNANDASLGNSVGGKGGAIYNDGVGGSAKMTLTHSTLSDNLANGANHFGGAMVNVGSGASATIVNTIFWANQASALPEILNSNSAAPNIDTSVVAGGCPANAICTGVISTDPTLSALSENGGFTATMPIATTGAAFDAANDATCTTADQRGVIRPQGAHCDIGAFELVPPHLCLVDHAAIGADDGLAWSSAYVDLQSALNDAGCNEVWVARGLYKPTAGTDVAASFNIRPGLQMYGGFVGGEISRDQAEPGTNRTVLSGDIDGNDITDTEGVVVDADPAAGKIIGDNSGTVVHLDGTTSAGTIGASTVVDGFVITAGTGGHYPITGNRIGGGLYCNGSGNGHACNPRLTRLTFSGNRADFGGAIFNNAAYAGISSPIIDLTTLNGNFASLSGGAILNFGYAGSSNPEISNSTFSGNTAIAGAAICNNSAQSGGETSPLIKASTFAGNHALSDGIIFSDSHDGAIAETTLVGVIMWNGGASEIAHLNVTSSTIIQDSIVAGGCPATQATCQDISANDPQLGPLQDNGGSTWTHLPGPNGSAIDAADPVLCGSAPFDVDQRGNARPQGPACDIGATELRQAQFAVSVSGPGSISANESSTAASGRIVDCDEVQGTCVAGFAIEPSAATIVLDITPGENSHLDSIFDSCGEKESSLGILTGNQYTITPVTNDCLVAATFALDTHSVGGTISGLVGSGFALQLDADELLPISFDGPFEFESVVESGSSYAVTIATQPGQPTQTCVVSNGSGVIDASDITNVEVSCTIDSYTVGGQVSGLLGTGLSLQLGAQNLPIGVDGNFTFATPLESGSAYDVMVATSPSQPSQLCTVANASGIVGSAAITDVAVTCNMPTPQLLLSVENNRDYLRYGRFVDYIVTLQNNGDGAATNVAVTSSLSNAFDEAFAQWQCFGAGAGAQCTAAGSGMLIDSASLPPGRTLTWRVSVPVRTDAADDDATFTVNVAGATPVSASDTDLLVLLRDGFDEPYASVSSLSEIESQAIINGNVVRELNLQQEAMDIVDNVVSMRNNGGEILVQRSMDDAHHQWIRLMRRNAEGREKITAWARVLQDAHLVIGAMADAQATQWILLEGAETPLLMKIHQP